MGQGKQVNSQNDQQLNRTLKLGVLGCLAVGCFVAAGIMLTLLFIMLELMK